MPSMTCVSTFGLTVACGNRPLSDLSTFSDAVLNTGGARLLLFVSTFDIAITASEALVFVVVVAGDDVVVVVLVVVPPGADVIEEMLTVNATLDEVTAADEADVRDAALNDDVTGAAFKTFSLPRECDSISFGDDFRPDGVECVCDTVVGVVLIKSVRGQKLLG